MTFLLIICILTKVLSLKYDIPYSSLLLIFGLILGIIKTNTILDIGLNYL